MVVGKGALVDDFRTEFDKALKETFGNGDAGDGPDPQTTKKRKGFGFPGDYILEVQRVVGAGEDSGVAVVATDLFFEGGLIFALAFGEKDEIGAFEGVGRLTEDAPGEYMAIAERILPIHE